MYFKYIFKLIINNNKNTVQDTTMRINTNVSGRKVLRNVISGVSRLVATSVSAV